MPGQRLLTNEVSSFELIKRLHNMHRVCHRIKSMWMSGPLAPCISTAIILFHQNVVSNQSPHNQPLQNARQSRDQDHQLRAQALKPSICSRALQSSRAEVTTITSTPPGDRRSCSTNTTGLLTWPSGPAFCHTMGQLPEPQDHAQLPLNLLTMGVQRHDQRQSCRHGRRDGLRTGGGTLQERPPAGITNHHFLCDIKHVKRHCSNGGAGSAATADPKGDASGQEAPNCSY